MKGVLTVTAAAFLGNMIAERWILRVSPDGPGFVDVEQGIGMDDFARALAIGLTAWGIKRFLPRF